MQILILLCFSLFCFKELIYNWYIIKCMYWYNEIINPVLCLIKVNGNPIGLTVRTSCYCILDLLCVNNSNWNLANLLWASVVARRAKKEIDKILQVIFFFFVWVSFWEWKQKLRTICTFAPLISRHKQNLNINLFGANLI